MKMFLLSSYLKRAANPFQLLNLDYESDSNRLPLPTIKLPTATETLPKSSSAKDSEKMKFRKQCVNLLVM